MSQILVVVADVVNDDVVVAFFHLPSGRPDTLMSILVALDAASLLRAVLYMSPEIAHLLYAFMVSRGLLTRGY